MAKLCCSIEMEPRTLNQGQLNLAREVAVDIVQNNEVDEASNIFIEGLRPVAAIKEMELMIQKENSFHNPVKFEEIETSCQCACVSGINLIDTPDQAQVLKEPLSAPF